MAVFLAVACIELIQLGVTRLDWPHLGPFALAFLTQMVGGAVIGLAGGYALVGLINRMKLDSGLYPILALAGALLIYSGSHFVHASGFLAVFLAGVVVGNRRHRARQLIDRFQDGIAWLSQIVMFVMLGLLVTPSDLVSSLIPAFVIAAVLIFLARPLASALCLAPFRFNLREHAFIAWVGLRGAVPIFIGAMPVLAEVEGARIYFDVAFVVVLTSLLPFSLTWWSFTFPIGTCVTGLTGLAAHTHLAVFDAMAVAGYTLLVAAWIIVAARTFHGSILEGTLFQKPATTAP